MRQGRPGAFGGVAMPPPAARQRPGELASRPALGLGEADRPQERAGLLVLHRPHAAMPELPVPYEKRHVTPAPAPVPRLRPSADEIAHHLGVPIHRGVTVQIAGAEPPQPQALRRQDRDRDGLRGFCGLIIHDEDHSSQKKHLLSRPYGQIVD